MSHSAQRIVLLVVIAVTGSWTPAGAGQVFLSGDGNIGNPLDGSGGAPVDAGNQQFFENVLQGGDSIVIHGDFFDGGSLSLALVPGAINDFYNSLAGVRSSIFNGTVTDGVLADADLFVAMLPDDPYSVAELHNMEQHLQGGGDIFFLGDNGAFAEQNAIINEAMSVLGSGMSILSTLVDAGYNTAIGDQIIDHPFTEGVDTFTYAAASEISSGTTLFVGTGGEPFLAFEVVPAPASSILLAAAALAGGRRRRAKRGSPGITPMTTRSVVRCCAAGS